MAPQQTLTVKVVSFTIAVTFGLIPLSASLPARDTTSPEAAIVNGTSVGIDFMQDTFVFCKAQVVDTGKLQLYHVMWQDVKGEPIPLWSKEAKVFALGTGYHVPHSYLVFHDFSSKDSGDYSCALFLQGNKIHSSTISVTEATESVT